MKLRLIGWNRLGVVALSLAAIIQPGSASAEIPTISDELPLTADRIGPASTSERAPAVASGDGLSLVVWEDLRSGESRIYGARIADDGALLDPSGFPISFAPGGQSAPDVAWDGANFLVVWVDLKSRAGLGTDISGSRVSPTGEILDPAGLAISTADHWERAPAVAWGGTHYLVVWAEARTGRPKIEARHVFATKVSAQGVVLDPGGIPIQSRGGFCEFVCVGNSEFFFFIPDVAWDGTQFLVTWSEAARGIRAARVTTPGLVLDPGGFTVTSQQGFSPAISWDGTKYLVIWSDRIYGPTTGIRGARVTRDAQVLDNPTIQIATALTGLEYDVVWDASNHWVLWSDGNLRATRVDPEGGLASIDLAEGPAIESHPGAALAGERLVVAWQVSPGSDSHIHGAIFEREGDVVPPGSKLISQVVSDSRVPSLAWSGTSFIAVWEEANLGSSQDIYAATMSQDGTLINPRIPVTTGLTYDHHPTVAWSGNAYLVVWQSGTSTIRGTRVDPNGVILDPQGFVISRTQGEVGEPAVAWVGTHFFVAWQHREATNYDWDILLARIGADGSLLDAGDLWVATLFGVDETRPALFYNGVVTFIGVEKENEVWAARLGPQGLPLSNALQIARDARMVSMWGGGGTVLFAWESLRSNSLPTRIRAARLRNGQVLDPDGIEIAKLGANPSVTWDGVNFVVAWRNPESLLNSDDVLAARVTSNGEVLEPHGIAIASSSEPELYPNVAHVGNGRVALAFTRWIDGRRWKSYVRFIQE